LKEKKAIFYTEHSKTELRENQVHSTKYETQNKMLIPIFYMELMRKMSFLIFLLCFWISLKNQNAEPEKGFTTARWSSSVDSSLVFLASSSPQPMVLSSEKEMLEFNGSGSLEYDFYRNLCPQAEQIVRAVVQRLHEVRSDVAPALLRLVFHDCFIEVSFLVLSC
jgi:peroxidase